MSQNPRNASTQTLPLAGSIPERSSVALLSRAIAGSPLRSHVSALCLGFATALAPLACVPRRDAAPRPEAGDAPAASVTVTSACAPDLDLALEVFEQTPGLRASVEIEGTRQTGWMLLDTATTLTKVRADAAPDLSVALSHSAIFHFGDNMTATLPVGLDAFPGIRAPAGGQLALVGTDLLGSYAVRFDFVRDRVGFTDFTQACAPSELSKENLQRLDTAGYFQQADAATPWAPVSAKWLAPDVPTIVVDVLGVRARAQLDTGYSGSESHFQVNAALHAQLVPRLGAVEVVSLGGAELKSYELPAGALQAIGPDGTSISSLGPSRLVLKTGDQSIAAWEVPAALLSARTVRELFDLVELRADDAAVWVAPRRPQQ